MRRILPVVLAMLVALPVLAVAAAPERSLAIVQTAEGLLPRQVATPAPGPGEVRVRVVAAGVNPVDWKRKAEIPGFDAAGIVDSVGPGVATPKPGDPVIAWVTGGYAEYAVAKADETVRKPAGFTYAQAAGVPIAGVAAWRAVSEVRLQRGQRVAVIGAAGGTGEATVQLARAQGAEVIAVGHSSQRAFLQAQGVAAFIAYDTEDVAARVGTVDAAINLVDGQATAALGYVKRGGRFSSIAGAPDAARLAAAGVEAVVIAGPTYRGVSIGDSLRALAVAAQAGQYTVTVTRLLPLAEAGTAQQLARTGQSIGKTVLVVDPLLANRY
jgi:NADPH:quinone reductase-like Zn-dependent oxidoreductase